MAVRAVRGATQLDEDTREHMLDRVAEIVTDVMEANGLVVDDFISIIFTATSDLVSEFPAYAARQLGFCDVPLICARELEIEGSMPRVVRMMAHVETDLPRADITHVYLHGAANLRRDLTRRPAMTESRTCRPSPDRSRSSAPGLIGTSVALVCRRLGLEVVLRDTSAENVRTATGLGAGRADDGDRPPAAGRGGRAARPPRRCDGRDALERTDAVVTDVGSVKAAPLAAVAAPGAAADLARYVGSHPMAGSERSGPLAASAALFDGRPWAVTPHAERRPAAVGWSRRWSGVRRRRRCSWTPPSTTAPSPAPPTCRTWPPSWSPAGSPTRPPSTSRCPGRASATSPGSPPSDPALWQQILAANAGAVLDLLGEVRDRPRRAHAPRSRDGDRGSRWSRSSAAGVAGTAGIPGKHGGPARPTRSVFVSVPDHPGELARLFGDAGEIGVNIEDVHIDHDPGRPVGLVELVVEEGRAEHLLARSRIPRLDDPPVTLLAREQRRGRPGPPVPRHRRRRHLRVGQVEHLARRGRAPRPALPRHRRDVPGDDLVAAAPQRAHERGRDAQERQAVPLGQPPHAA